MGAEGKLRIILRGVGFWAALILTLGVIIWDIVSIGIPPPSVEWALLFIAANAAFLICGWYASHYLPRRLRA